MPDSSWQLCVDGFHLSCTDYAKSFGASTWGKIKDGEKEAKEAWEKAKEEKPEESKDEL